MDNFKFFQNKECEYFPCHKIKEEKNFNCLFCYCPLYLTNGYCGGNFTYTKNGIKDCSNCILPHKKENYDYINKKLYEASLMTKQNELKNIKMIVTDLDHTILKDEFSIDDVYIDTFGKLKQKGYITVFSTARGFYQAYNFAYKIKPDYIICDNGASIIKYDYEKEEKNIIKQTLIPAEVKLDILNTLKDDDTLLYLIESKKDLYITDCKYAPEFVKKNTEFFSKVKNTVKDFSVHKIKSLSEMPFNIPLTRICTFDYVNNPDTKKTLSYLGEKHKEINYSKSFQTTFEFGCTNKGNALKYLIEYTGLKKENIISFGDSITDLSMFEESGVSVAVENGVKELKDKAMYICESVFNDGVNKFIKEKFF